MTMGTWMAHELQFKSTVYPLHFGGLTVPGYAALWALAANLGVAAALSAVLNGLGVDAGMDATKAEDYGGA
jgi:SSS family solute:Na+ symporter